MLTLFLVACWIDRGIMGFVTQRGIVRRMMRRTSRSTTRNMGVCLLKNIFGTVSLPIQILLFAVGESNFVFYLFSSLTMAYDRNSKTWQPGSEMVSIRRLRMLIACSDTGHITFKVHELLGAAVKKFLASGR